tara:strand:+ start:1022 stop:1240 length:219 start_codon:yes stop_codon:yes gene_type:complete
MMSAASTVGLDTETLFQLFADKARSGDIIALRWFADHYKPPLRSESRKVSLVDNADNLSSTDLLEIALKKMA